MENNKFKPINGYEFNAWVGINQTKKMMIMKLQQISFIYQPSQKLLRIIKALVCRK